MKSTAQRPAGGPTLGVLGGMGPAAAAEFLRLFTMRWPAGCDQDHPRVILLSEPSIPSRTAALLGAAPNPSRAIEAALRRLVIWGADLLAIPCNTAFAFLEKSAAELPVPLVHTVDEALRAAKMAVPGAVWLLATDGMLASGIYQRRAETSGLSLLLPEAREQARLQEVIHAVKAGELERGATLLLAVVERLSEQRGVPFLLGCTELPLAWRAAGEPSQAVDSLDALATACVRLLPSVPANSRWHTADS